MMKSLIFTSILIIALIFLFNTMLQDREDEVTFIFFDEPLEIVVPVQRVQMSELVITAVPGDPLLTASK